MSSLGAVVGTHAGPGHRRLLLVPGMTHRFATTLQPSGAFLDSLAFTHRREYVEWIEDAKREETRQSRIVKAVEMLRRGRRTPK